MISVVLALLASLANAAASVLQRKAAEHEPAQRQLSPRLILDLMRRPVWFAGVGSILAGFLLQAGALSTGAIAEVQPLLICELPLTLVLASRVFRSGMRRYEWLTIAMMSVGLAGFLFALQPQGGSPLAAPLLDWAVGVSASVLVSLGFVVLARRFQEGPRAALMGIGAGIMFGLVAALVAVMGAAYQHGLAAVFATWQTYLVVVLGPTGFFLLQNALQAGKLVASQPALTLSNPLVGICWGIAVFGERMRGGGWLFAAAAGAVLVAAGTTMLSRSPMLSGPSGKRKESQRERTARRR